MSARRASTTMSPSPEPAPPATATKSSSTRNLTVSVDVAAERVGVETAPLTPTGSSLASRALDHATSQKRHSISVRTPALATNDENSISVSRSSSTASKAAAADDDSFVDMCAIVANTEYATKKRCVLCLFCCCMNVRFLISFSWRTFFFFFFYLVPVDLLSISCGHRMKTLARADSRLWATPNRIQSVDDAVRQWSTLQILADSDLEQQARLEHALAQHVRFLTLSLV